jgi:hypothetical protein
MGHARSKMDSEDTTMKPSTNSHQLPLPDFLSASTGERN